MILEVKCTFHVQDSCVELHRVWVVVGIDQGWKDGVVALLMGLLGVADVEGAGQNADTAGSKYTRSGCQDLVLV